MAKDRRKQTGKVVDEVLLNKHESVVLAERALSSFSRLTRSIEQLLREHLANSPVTVQQCYCLEALASGPLSMSTLAREVGLHQSTLSRIVSKIEKLGLVQRQRKTQDQRTVMVTLTAQGQNTYKALDQQCTAMVASLLMSLPKSKCLEVVDAVGVLNKILDPQSSEFRNLLTRCQADIKNQ